MKWGDVVNHIMIFAILTLAGCPLSPVLVDEGEGEGEGELADQCPTLDREPEDCSRANFVDPETHEVVPAVRVVNGRESVCTCCEGDGRCGYVERPCTLGVAYDCEAGCPYEPLASTYGDGVVAFGGPCTPDVEGDEETASDGTRATCVCCTAPGFGAPEDAVPVCAWSH